MGDVADYKLGDVAREVDEHWNARQIREQAERDRNTTAGKVGEPPSHYAGDGLTPFQVIDAFKLGFYLGNAVKYILRCMRKGSAVNDLRKAVHYLEEAIIRIERGETNV